MNWKLQDRVSFWVFFCDLYVSSDFPDHSTLCNFLIDLVNANMIEAVFDEITAQLEAPDLKIKGCKIVIFDTTVKLSEARPMTKPTKSEAKEVCADYARHQE